MKKKLIIVGIAVLLVLLVVAALVIIPKTKIPEYFAKKIKIGVSENSPYSIYTSDNTVTGFSANFAKTIFEDIGYKVIFVKTTADEQNRLLQNGEIDCYIDATSKNEPNTFYSKEYVSCVQGTFYNNPEITVNSSKDFKNYKCAFISGSSANDYLTKNDAKGLPVANAQLAVKAVKEGTADICIIDNYFINEFLKLSDYSDFKSGIYLYNEKHYIAFSEKNRPLINKVNSAISKYKKNGSAESWLNLYGLKGFAN